MKTSIKNIIILFILMMMNGCATNSSYEENQNYNNFNYFKQHFNDDKDKVYTYLGPIKNYIDFNVPLQSYKMKTLTTTNGKTESDTAELIINRKNNFTYDSLNDSSFNCTFSVNLNTQDISDISCKSLIKGIDDKFVTKLAYVILGSMLKRPNKIKSGTIIEYTMFGLSVKEKIKGWGVYNRQKVIVSETNQNIVFNGKKISISGYQLYDPRTFIPLYGEGNFIIDNDSKIFTKSESSYKHKNQEYEKRNPMKEDLQKTLSKWYKLYKDGAISKEEYNKIKTKLLAK